MLEKKVTEKIKSVEENENNLIRLMNQRKEREKNTVKFSAFFLIFSLTMLVISYYLKLWFFTGLCSFWVGYHLNNFILTKLQIKYDDLTTQVLEAAFGERKVLDETVDALKSLVFKVKSSKKIN